MKAKDRDTIVTGKTLGHPVRSIKNSFSRDFYTKEIDGHTTKDELENMGKGSLYRAAIEGDIKTGSCMCGQICGMVKEEETCKEIIDKIVLKADTLLKR